VLKKKKNQKQKAFLSGFEPGLQIPTVFFKLAILSKSSKPIQKNQKRLDLPRTAKY
jgi:hypothetical protein